MTKKTRIRIWIIVVIVWVMWFSDCSFAEDNSKLVALGFDLGYIISSLAWLWVILAKLAWEFLTNRRVYGEILWIDVLLRKYRNVIKNFANFWLWFYFVYTIFKWLISTWKGSITTTLKSNLLWLIVAGVWIQASWFLTALLIDTSTITLAAAGALPSQIISSNANISKSVEENLKKTFTVEWSKVTEPIQLDLFCDDSKASELLCKHQDKSKIDPPQSLTWLIDQMMPRADDVSWPLYFMWFSILSTSKIASINSASLNSIKATIFNLIIQWWTTIIFSIEMLVLCVVALIRIFYLWMFIMLSPIAILLWCIGQTWDNKLKDTKFYKSITKHLNISAFLVNVFKPTIIVLWLWVAIIFVSFMETTILNFTGKSFNYKGVEFSSMEEIRSNVNAWDTRYTSVMDHDLFNFTLRSVWKTMLELILSILTVILVYQIIKAAVTMWGWENDIIWKRINKIQEWVWDILWSVPVLPVAWYDKEWAPTTHYISANKVFDIKNGEPTSELLNRTIEKYQLKVNDRYNEQNQIINSWFGDVAWYLSADEVSAIENVSWKWIDLLKNKKDKILSIRNDEKNTDWKWMTLNPQTSSNNGFWIQEFTKWLEWMKNQNVSWTSYDPVWNNMISRWNDDNNKDKTLEKMFKGNKSREMQSVKAYADFFELWWNITTWEQLKNADISKK